MRNTLPLFITVEGGDGSGKSTALVEIIKFLKEDLKLDVVEMREPGGSNISEQIRNVIVDPANSDMAPEVEVLLYAASRCQNVYSIIKDSLVKGKTVVSDRWVESSIAYQGAGRNLNERDIINLDRKINKGIVPDITLWFDVDPEVGLNRINANSDREVNRMDQQQVDFYYKIREGYIKQYKQNPRIVRIDANQPIDEVVSRAKEILKLFITYALEHGTNMLDDGVEI